jgi:hypothetical protein
MCRGSFTRVRTEHPSTWPLEILFTASGYPSVGNSYRSCEDSLRQRRVSLISAVVFFVSVRSSVPDERFLMRSGAFGRYWHRFRIVTKLCNTGCFTYKGLRVCSLHFEHRVCLRGGGAVLPTKYYSGDQIEKTEMDMACSTYEEEKRGVQGFGGETLGNETTSKTQA